MHAGVFDRDHGFTVHDFFFAYLRVKHLSHFSWKQVAVMPTDVRIENPASCYVVDMTNVQHTMRMPVSRLYADADSNNTRGMENPDFSTSHISATALAMAATNLNDRLHQQSQSQIDYDEAQKRTREERDLMRAHEKKASGLQDFAQR